MLAGSLFAVPAKRFTLKVKQADGTTLSVQLTGDESFHYYRTLDGVPVVQRADGTYCYAALRDGQLCETARIAHEAAARTDEEKLFISQSVASAEALNGIVAERLQARNARRVARLNRRMAASASTSRVGEMNGAITGDRKGLVILVNFKDKKMNEAHTRQVFDDMMNKEGYTGNGNHGSVHDYFYKQSYGKFNLTFDVFGPVTVSRNMSYYGSNENGTAGYDKYPHIMVEEALELIADDPTANWADYDWDNDGYIDQVFVIYAGYNEAQGGAASTIWPHESTLAYYGYSKTFGGKKVDIYGCSSELRGSYGNDIDGIGTACHEFSHCLGLPDLYDTSSSGSNFGLNTWSLMDYGSYNDDSCTPTAYTSYERMVSGWLTPTELKQGCSVTEMKPLVDSPEAYIIYNDANRNEYYLLENRQQKDFDKYIGGHGMLVMHVDYDATVWENNTVNNVAKRQRCTIIPADNNFSTSDSGLAGDPFPGTSANHALTDATKPAATLYNANTDGNKYMGKPITEIYEDNGLISFNFMGGKQIDVPSGLSTTDISSTSFTANWQPVDDATSYDLEVREAGSSLPSDNVTDEVDFSKWGNELTADKNADIADRLDALMPSAGWTGTKVYEGPARVKLGSSSVPGVLNSPLYSAPASGSVTVRFNEQVYNLDTKRVTVALVNKAGKDLKTEDFVLSGSEHIANFDGITAEYKVSFRPAKRCYLTKKLDIYDGNYTADDFADESSVAEMAPAKRAAHLTVNTKDTYYAVTGLNPDATYLWRVRAVNDKSASYWTDLQSISLPSGIVSVQTAQPAAGDTVEVYAADGRHLRSARFTEWDNGLPAGTYLLRHANGTVKAAVR